MIEYPQSYKSLCYYWGEKVVKRWSTYPRWKEHSNYELAHYWQLVETDNHEIYLICSESNRGLIINIPDEYTDNCPYNWISENGFDYIFERFSEHSFGVPRDIIQLTNLLKEDYPKYKRISKINTIL